MRTFSKSRNTLRPRDLSAHNQTYFDHAEHHFFGKIKKFQTTFLINVWESWKMRENSWKVFKYEYTFNLKDRFSNT